MEVVLMCAWCGRVRMNGWVEGNEATRVLSELRERRISHGICDRCFEQLTTVRRAERAERPVR
jgi:hypothetical protein